MNGILVGVVIAVMIAAVIGLPFMKRRRRWSGEMTEASALGEQLQQAINAVRDLDFDFDTGKIGEDDYVSGRKLLVGRGVSLLIRAEAARQQTQGREDELEAQINAHRVRHRKTSKAAR